MKIQNSKLIALSIVGFLAASNISFAEGCDSCAPPLSGQELNYTTQQLNDLARELNNLNISSDAIGASLIGSAWPKDAKEAGKKDKTEQVKDEYPDSEKPLISKLETIYELNGLGYNYIFGLLLDFSEGKLSIENLGQEMSNKVKACQKKEKELLGNSEESSEIKMYSETITQMWKLYAGIVSTDKKNLQEQKTSLEKLREQYAKLAAGWFSYQYGMKDKEVGNNLDASSNTESQESKKSKHMTKEKSPNAMKNQQKITKSYLEENTKNLSLLARGVSGDQATNLINKQIRSK